MTCTGYRLPTNTESVLFVDVVVVVAVVGDDVTFNWMQLGSGAVAVTLVLTV